MNFIAILLALGLLVPTPPSSAEDKKKEEPVETSWNARVTEVSGDVVLFAGEEEEGVRVEADTPLREGDRIQTGADARAEIALEADSVMELGPESDFTVGSLEKEETSFTLGLGRVVAKLRSYFAAGRLARFNTPTAVAAVRGTEFGLEVSEQGDTTVGVFDEGKVAVRATDVEDVEETLLEPEQEVAVPFKGKPGIRRHKGRRYLQVRKLAHLKGRMDRLKHLRKRRAALRRMWRHIPPAKRAEMRKAMMERHKARLRKLSPKKRRALMMRMKRRKLPAQIKGRVGRYLKLKAIRRHKQELRKGSRLDRKGERMERRGERLEEQGRRKAAERLKRRGERMKRRGGRKGRRGRRRGR